MLKRVLFPILILLSGTAVHAQTFSFATEADGFAYASKGACLLRTNLDTTHTDILFTLNKGMLTNCKCFKVTFNTNGDEIIPIEKELPANEWAFSADSSSITLKKMASNAGYLVQYGDSTCDAGSPCKAFTWLTDYLKIDSITWAKDTVLCEDLQLSFSPTITYRTQYGNEKEVERTLKVKYQSWLAEGDEDPKITDITTEASGADNITLEQFPYVDTPFEVEDISAERTLQKILTDTFFTQAVVAYPVVETDSAQIHEGEQGSEIRLQFVESSAEALNNVSNFRSSGPLELNFVSRSNAMTNHYEWAIAQGENATRGDFRSAFVLFEKDVNAYIVSDPGMYCIELTVSNIRNDSVCEHKSYGCFQIATSDLYIPNTFTPNGDGTNDEFRVAYRSIKSFYCCIYDQWGRRVYESDDITKGWDGTTANGRAAHVGTYFYVIKATGTDGISYNKKGTINLVRSK